MLTLETSLKKICDEIWDSSNPEHLIMKIDWFSTPSEYFNNEAPKDIMMTSKGSRRIKQVLLSQIYGVFL